MGEELRDNVAVLIAMPWQRPTSEVPDVGHPGLWRIGHVADSGLLVRPLLKIRLGVYASPEYLTCRPALERPSDFGEHSLIVTNCNQRGEPGETAHWRLRRKLETYEARVTSRISAPDPAITLQLALSGAGVAQLAQAVATPYVERGELIRVLPEWEPEAVALYALYSARLSSSPKVRAFLQFLRDCFRGESGILTPARHAAAVGS